MFGTLSDGWFIVGDWLTQKVKFHSRFMVNNYEGEGIDDLGGLLK